MYFLGSLRFKLAGLFLVTAAAPLLAVLYLTAAPPEEAIERQTIAAMAGIAEAKGARLEALGRERTRNILSISDGFAFVGAVEALGATYAADGTRDEATYDAALAKYKQRIDDFAAACEFPRFMIADASGRVVYSTKETPLLHRSIKETPISKVLERVRTEKRPFISPPMPSAKGERPLLEIVGPLLKGGEVVGYASGSISPTEIDAIVTDYTGLGTTGDIVGVCHLAGDVVVTTPMRANPDAAYTVRGKLASDFAPRFQEIVYGNPLRGRGKDIEGDDVFGSWVRVQSLGWGLGVTQHVEEAFSIVRAQQSAQKALVRNALLISIIPAAVLGFLVGALVERTQARKAS